jgi:hypothetical protein
VRFDGENVDDALTSLRLDSKESGVDPGPQLILSLNSSAVPEPFATQLGLQAAYVVVLLRRVFTGPLR